MDFVMDFENQDFWHEGSLEKPFSVLRGAVTMDDGLNYDEPWGVMTLVRHALGGLLLKSASSPCGCGAGGGGRNEPPGSWRPRWSSGGTSGCTLRTLGR